MFGLDILWSGYSIEIVWIIAGAIANLIVRISYSMSEQLTLKGLKD